MITRTQTEMEFALGATFVTLEGERGLQNLTRIPSSATSIMIRYCPSCNLELTQLPNHVTSLWLFNVSTTNAVTFPEGLELIYLHKVTSTVPMIRWIFPSSLQSLSFSDHGDLIDLRAVTSPSIVIENLLQDGGELRLPAALDQLTIDNAPRRTITNVTFAPVASSPRFRRVELPPYLRSLKLLAVGTLDDSVATSLEEVSLRYMDTSVNVNKLFPRVQSLELVKTNIGDSLRLPLLNSLVVQSCSGVVAFDTPNLESLSIDNFASIHPRFEVDPAHPTLGRSLTDLTISRAWAFPVVGEWERLHSVRVIRADVMIKLPFIQWLDKLTVDAPVSTNGVNVKNIDEYKQAWGVTNRKKGAKR